MIKKIDFDIEEFKTLKTPPENIYFKGNSKLLQNRKVSIVGTRHPNSYTYKFTHILASGLAKRGIKVVSGAAIGVDTIAHKSASAQNTIAVVANGLNIKYPAINKKLIEDIENNGLILSTYEKDEKARNYTFVQRNELVVALGEVLIVSEADLKSGSLSSVNYALKMNKKVYTIPHRIDESLGTQEFVKRGLIEPIYDIEKFLEEFGKNENQQKTELALYLETFPSYEDALLKYQNKIFELELQGLIKVENGFVKPI